MSTSPVDLVHCIAQLSRWALVGRPRGSTRSPRTCGGGDVGGGKDLDTWIPAKAGMTEKGRGREGCEVPACAGMTGWVWGDGGSCGRGVLLPRAPLRSRVPSRSSCRGASAAAASTKGRWGCSVWAESLVGSTSLHLCRR